MSKRENKTCNCPCKCDKQKNSVPVSSSSNIKPSKNLWKDELIDWNGGLAATERYEKERKEQKEDERLMEWRYG
jgi:hypothetical protein